MNKLHLIICGSRTFTDYEFFRDKCDFYLKRYLEFDTGKYEHNPKIEILSGCARGPDEMGIIYAAHNLISVKRFPADWNKHKKAAGHIRNKQMLDYILQFDSKGVLAFMKGESRGTANMCRISKDKGVNTKIVRV